MNTLKQLAKDINDIGDYEDMCKEEYIDPSELSGCCGGHWADENMISMEDEDYEKDEI